jgi:hypothetical protein
MGDKYNPTSMRYQPTNPRYSPATSIPIPIDRTKNVYRRVTRDGAVQTQTRKVVRLQKFDSDVENTSLLRRGTTTRKWRPRFMHTGSPMSSGVT